MTETKWICKWEGNGYFAEKQDYGSLQITFTDDPTEARQYKTRQAAARALNFRKWDSDKAKEVLRFYEVTIETKFHFAIPENDYPF